MTNREIQETLKLMLKAGIKGFSRLPTTKAKAHSEKAQKALSLIIARLDDLDPNATDATPRFYTADEIFAAIK